jgi:hypothetical protein
VKRVGLATLAGGLILVIWGMVFWAVVAPAMGVFQALPDAGTVTTALTSSNTPTGTYFMPWPRGTSEEFQRFVAQHKSGPFYQLHYVREGVDPNSPTKIGIGVMQYLVVAFLTVMLVVISRGATFGRRFGVIVIAGLIGTLFITIGDPVWFHLPWDYTTGVLVYEVVAWVLLGITVGAITRPPAAG